MTLTSNLISTQSIYHSMRLCYHYFSTRLVSGYRIWPTELIRRQFCLQPSLHHLLMSPQPPSSGRLHFIFWHRLFPILQIRLPVTSFQISRCWKGSFVRNLVSVWFVLSIYRMESKTGWMLHSTSKYKRIATKALRNLHRAIINDL